MSDEQRPALGGQSFEDLKQTNEHGAEYWSARDIQSLLGYTSGGGSRTPSRKPKRHASNRVTTTDRHFAGAGKMVLLGSKGQ